MPRKRPMTFKHHEAVAAELFEVRCKLMDLLPNLSPHLNKTQANKLCKAISAVDAVRCMMDDELCKTHPAQFNPRVYYPGVIR